jgi:hypothetical protein
MGNSLLIDLAQCVFFPLFRSTCRYKKEYAAGLPWFEEPLTLDAGSTPRGAGQSVNQRRYVDVDIILYDRPLPSVCKDA